MTAEPTAALDAVERLRQAAFRPAELTPGLTVVGQYDLRAILAHIDALTAERDAAVAALAQRDADIVAWLRVEAANAPVVRDDCDVGEWLSDAADAIEAGAYKGAGDPAPPADGEG
jgi:hypothetical protein